MTGQPTTQLVKIDGKLVLVDPDAVAALKVPCRNIFELNRDRVAHFKQRMADRGLTADEMVIVLIQVDDPNGRPLADELIPNYDWQVVRDAGAIPYARGMVDRRYMEDALKFIDLEVSQALKNTTEPTVVVITDGTAEIFSA